MKKGLLGSTALVGATALMAGAAGAAEAPTWKLTGNANFQLYFVDADAKGTTTTGIVTTSGSVFTLRLFTTAAVTGAQDHGWYFGVDESELQLNVSGTADNGLNYGFKIELNANTTENGNAADEVRLQLSGGWGTLQMGDEDGAEDIMNYGGENLMGATGGFDGDQDDYIIRVGTISATFVTPSGVTTVSVANLGAPGYPTIAGDTSDQTKVSYFSPRVSGFQVGASLTPTPNNGDNFKQDGLWENHIGLGANYDNSVSGMRIRASIVYSGASSNITFIEDVAALSVGGIVGFGPISVGANYTDNSDSGQVVGLGMETSYWNIAASYEAGPLYVAAGYTESTLEFGPAFGPTEDSVYSHLALTADYSLAPGLAVYAEVNLIEDELAGGTTADSKNETTSFVLGANVSF